GRSGAFDESGPAGAPAPGGGSASGGGPSPGGGRGRGRSSGAGRGRGSGAGQVEDSGPVGGSGSVEGPGPVEGSGPFGGPSLIGRPVGGLRLLVDGAARAGDGGRPVAAELAHRLGLGVAAPDGPLVMLRGGELFSAGRGAGWTEFRPDRPPAYAGPRFPEPPWQRDLPDRLGGRPPAVGGGAPRAGIWRRAAGGAPASPRDGGSGVPAQPPRMAVVVGPPAEPPVPPLAVAAVLADLPAVLLANLVLVLYGPR